MQPITINKISYHRNGICGAGFHVVTFQHGTQRMVGIMFAEPGHVAVLDVDLLHQDRISRAEENTWRGDVFEQPLRHAIAQEERRQEGSERPT